jgi:hypothetical protein
MRLFKLVSQSSHQFPNLIPVSIFINISISTLQIKFESKIHMLRGRGSEINIRSTIKDFYEQYQRTMSSYDVTIFSRDNPPPRRRKKPKARARKPVVSSTSTTAKTTNVKNPKGSVGKLATGRIKKRSQLQPQPSKAPTARKIERGRSRGKTCSLSPAAYDVKLGSGSDNKSRFLEPTASGPSGVPTAGPSGVPTAGPSNVPIAGPSGVSRAGPSGVPAAGPSGVSRAGPSGVPAAGPSGVSRAGPSGVAAVGPSGVSRAGPSGVPTASPSGISRAGPSGVPAASPSGAPKAGPSGVKRMSVCGTSQQKNGNGGISPELEIPPQQCPRDIPLDENASDNLDIRTERVFRVPPDPAPGDVSTPMECVVQEVDDDSMVILFQSQTMQIVDYHNCTSINLLIPL